MLNFNNKVLTPPTNRVSVSELVSSVSDVWMHGYRVKHLLRLHFQFCALRFLPRNDNHGVFSAVSNVDSFFLFCYNLKTRTCTDLPFKAVQLQCQFYAESFTCDFEKGLVNATQFNRSRVHFMLVLLETGKITLISIIFSHNNNLTI